MKLTFYKSCFTILFITIFITFGSQTAMGQYCLPEYINGTADGDFIDDVILEDISNTGSGGEITDVGYSDYTDLSAMLNVGESYTLELTNNPDWSETFTAWIDYDQDGEFSDDEVLDDSGIGGIDLLAGENGSLEFTVPFTALAGATVMRVRCAFPSGLEKPLDPCSQYNYGETEDYTINIGSSSAFDIGILDIVGISSGLWFRPVRDQC